MSLILALILSLGSFALGDVLLRALGLPTRGFERVGLAIAAGLALSLFLLYLPLALAGHAYFAPLAVLQGLAILASLPSWTRSLRSSSRGALALGAVFLLAGLGVVRVAMATPFSSYDDRAIYGLKGKILWLERNVAGQVFGDLEVINYHRNYPLGLPLLIGHSAWVGNPNPFDPTGREPAADANEWVARYDAVSTYAPWSVLWLAGLAAMAAALAWRAGDTPLERLALLPLALPLATVFPWVAGDSWSLSGADLPMTLLVGAAAWSLVEWWRTRAEHWLWLVGLLAGAMFLIKQDALLSFSAGLAALLLARGPRPRLSSALLVLGSVALAFAAVTYTGRSIPTPTFEENYTAALLAGSPGRWLERMPLILTSAWSALDRGYMTVFWLASLLVALPVGWRRGGWTRFLALWVALHLACSLCVFLVTPDHVAWHVQTAFTRILCHMAFPAGMLLVGYVAERLVELRRAILSSPAP